MFLIISNLIAFSGRPIALNTAGTVRGRFRESRFSPARRHSPEVFTPGITQKRTSETSAGHSHPYPSLLEVLYDIHTCSRNLWKFCTPLVTIPGVRVQHVLYPLGKFMSPVRQCHNNTQIFWKFCKTSVPVPGTSGSSVRSSYP